MVGDDVSRTLFGEGYECIFEDYLVGEEFMHVAKCLWCCACFPTGVWVGIFILVVSTRLLTLLTTVLEKSALISDGKSKTETKSYKRPSTLTRYLGMGHMGVQNWSR